MYRDDPIPGATWTNWMGITVPGDLAFNPGEGNAPNLNSAVGGGVGGADREKTVGHSLCGDIAPRNGFMAGGPYGPTIPRGVYIAGETMEVKVKLTAYHAGWLEFRLCKPTDQAVDTKTPITQECLNQNVLKIHSSTPEYANIIQYQKVGAAFRCKNPAGKIDSTSTTPNTDWPKGSCCNGGGDCSNPMNNVDRYCVEFASTKPSYTIILQVPSTVTCDRCVLQMLYQTGNSIDNFPETFYNCADIKILPSGTTGQTTGCAAYTPVAGGGSSGGGGGGGIPTPAPIAGSSEGCRSVCDFAGISTGGCYRLDVGACYPWAKTTCDIYSDYVWCDQAADGNKTTSPITPPAIAEFPTATCDTITSSCDAFSNACAAWCDTASVQCGLTEASTPDGYVTYRCKCSNPNAVGQCLVKEALVDNGDTATTVAKVNCENDGGCTQFKTECGNACTAIGSSAYNRQCYDFWPSGTATLCKCTDGTVVTGAVCGSTGIQLAGDGTTVSCCSAMSKANHTANCPSSMPLCTGSTQSKPVNVITDVTTSGGGGAATGGNYGAAPDMSIARVVRSASMLPGADPVVSLGDIDANFPNVARVMRVFPISKWNVWFALANKGAGPNQNPYSYENFLKAVAKFPYFCNEGTAAELQADEVCKRELAALMAQFVQETGANTEAWGEKWKQGLYYFEELGCDSGSCTGYSLTGPEDFTHEYPCAAGKTYHGRGAHQLSYCYNYGPFSYALYGDDRVLKNPDMVIQSWLALASALWFYMTPASPKPSMHDVVVGHWVPNAADTAAGLTVGLGALVNIINGGIECGSGTESFQSQNRGLAHAAMCTDLGITCNAATNGCKDMRPFSAEGAAGKIPAYWGKDWSSTTCKLVTYQTAYSYFMQGSKSKCELFYYNAVSSVETTTGAGDSTAIAGGVGSDNAIRCGIDWADANTKCGGKCVSDSECVGAEKCFSGVDATRCSGTIPASSSTSPTSNAPPSPTPGPATGSTGGSVRCGKGWTEANSKCGTSCVSDANCPPGEQCYAGVSTTLDGCKGAESGSGTINTNDKCQILAGHTRPNKQMVAFMENWVACPSDAQLAHYTKVVISFAVTYTWSASGNNCSPTCEYKVGSTPACNGMSLKSFVDRCHSLGVQVLISLGGAGMGGSWDTSINRCWDPCLTRVNQLADAVVEEVRQSGADGIDFDYEYILNEQKYVDFIEQWTLRTRERLDALGAGKMITMAPMSSDVDPNDPYTKMLEKVVSGKKIADRIDFMMPQYYNGFLRIPLASTDATEWARVETHYRNLVRVMGDASKMVFGFCNGDCISGHNANSQQALTVATKLDALFPSNGGSYFWAASDDTPAATWSQALADFYCQEEQVVDGCGEWGSYYVNEVRKADLQEITINNPYGDITFEQGQTDYFEVLADYKGLSEEQVASMADLSIAKLDAVGLKLSLTVPSLTAMGGNGTTSTAPSGNGTTTPSGNGKDVASGARGLAPSLSMLVALGAGLLCTRWRGMNMNLVLLGLVVLTPVMAVSTCDNPQVNMRVKVPAGCTIKSVNGGTAQLQCVPLATDPCATNNGNCQQVCTVNGSTRVCSCNSRYTLAADGQSCIADNPCATNNGGCQGLCSAPQGQVICSCQPNYKLAGDQVSCVAVDPCDTALGGCDPASTTCVYVSPGTSTCKCKIGYQVKDSSSCSAIPADPCATNPCGQGTCAPLNGIAVCSCPVGQQCTNTECTTCADPVAVGSTSCPEPAWIYGNTYVGGNCVQLSNKKWCAQWWTQSKPDEDFGSGKPWVLKGECASTAACTGTCCSTWAAAPNGCKKTTVQCAPAGCNTDVCCDANPCNTSPPVCEQKCTANANLYNCSCDTGTLASDGTCTKTDLCANNGGCADQCSAGVCSCTGTGTQLAADKKGCEAKPTGGGGGGTSGCGTVPLCVLGKAYNAGDICACAGVAAKFECTVPGWCSSSSEFYSPCGGYEYAHDAWKQGSC